MSNSFFAAPLTFDRVIRIVFGILLIVGICLLINMLSGVLLPFVIGWLLAYITNPIVEFFQFKLKIRNRIISVIITLLLFAAVLTGLVFLLSPMVSAEISKAQTLIADYTQHLNVYQMMPPAWQAFLTETFTELQPEKLFSDNFLLSLAQRVAPAVWGIFTGSLSILVGFFASFIALLYMIFIMIDYHAITKALFNIFPPKMRNRSTEILTDIGKTMNRYFRGQLLIAASVAVMMSVGFLIIGLPMAIVMGIFVGVCNLVPYMQTLSIPPVALLGLLRCAETGQTVWSMVIGLVVVYLVSQAVQDLLLTPKIMGKAMGLRPAYILLALSVWGVLLGFIGLIIALPLTQLCISYYKRLVLGQEQVE